MTNKPDTPYPWQARARDVAVIALSTFVLLVAWGCKSPKPVAHMPPLTVYRSPLWNEIAVRRVVILPPENATAHPAASERFLRNLQGQLQAAGLFEVVLLPPMDCSPFPPFSLDGTYPEPLLAELALRHQADGVLLLSLSDYQPYWPPRLGVRCHLVSTTEAVTLASVDGMWDTRDAPLAAHIEKQYQAATGHVTLARADLPMIAIHELEKYVAQQIVDALAKGELVLAPQPVFLPQKPR